MPKPNPRINARERGLIKGAIRRVFSRSDLRRKVLEACRIEHSDESRKRVTRWGECAVCHKPTALYQMQVDHISPVVPLDSTLELMSWDTVIDRLWCEENGLQCLCMSCHDEKTKQERQIRRKNKNVKTKRT